MKKPRRQKQPKTYSDLLLPEKGEVWMDEETGIVLRVEPTRLWPLGELLEKFYSIHQGLAPISFVLVDDPAEAIKEKHWYAIFYASWHARIICNPRDTGGPHQAQLWFKSQSMRKNFWVATLQLMAFYYNEDEMYDALIKAITEREFFITDEERDKCITV